jgi:hypothetical protein
MARQQGTDLDEVKTSRGGSNKVRIDEKIEVHKFKPNVYETHRIFGPTFTYAQYWVVGKKKDGSATKFPVDSPSWDPVKQEFDRSKYDPWYEHHLWEVENDVDEKKRLIQVGVSYWTLSISRKKQKDEPARRPKPTKEELKTGFKEKDSDSYTPVVALRLPQTPVKKIQGFKSMNVVESKSGGTKAYPVSHERYGHDVRIKFDDAKETAAGNRYDVQYVEKKSPLTEEELAELKWDLSNLANEATDAQVRSDFEGWAKRMGIKTSKKRKHDVEELDDELEEDEVDGEDEDEDEDEKPARGKKKPAAKKVAKKAPAKKTSKKKPVEEDEDDEDEDEDDEDLDDEDEDEEDERPARGKKKAPAKKVAAKKTSKKKPVDEDEDDEDDEDEEDEDDEDDLDDLDEDEEDEDEDDEEDEEDERPARGKKKAPAKKVAAKKTSKKKPVDEDEDDEEDDEDDEDDLDDDEDEDDEPPARSKKKAPAKKVAAKKKPARRSRDEDEDEDEEDEDD